MLLLLFFWYSCFEEVLLLLQTSTSACAAAAAAADVCAGSAFVVAVAGSELPAYVSSLSGPFVALRFARGDGGRRGWQNDPVCEHAVAAAAGGPVPEKNGEENSRCCGCCGSSSRNQSDT